MNTQSPANMLAAAQAKAASKATSQASKEDTVEKEFQVYKSSLPNQRIAMPGGKLISIVSGTYITDNEEEIAFLDKEVKAGFPYLQKGAAVTSSELDPMSALRAKIIAEAIADGTVNAVPKPVLTDTEAQKVVPTNTAQLAPNTANSNSQ